MDQDQKAGCFISVVGCAIAVIAVGLGVFFWYGALCMETYEDIPGILVPGRSGRDIGAYSVHHWGAEGCLWRKGRDTARKGREAARTEGLPELRLHTGRRLQDLQMVRSRFGLGKEIGGNPECTRSSIQGIQV